MSLEAYTAVWKLGRPLTPSKKMVLLAIADFAWPSGWAFPAIETIAEMACLERRRCFDIIDWLEKKGYLLVVPRGGWNGSNLYGIEAICKGAFKPPTTDEIYEAMRTKKLPPAHGAKIAPSAKIAPCEKNGKTAHEPLVNKVVVVEGPVEWPSEQETLDHGRKYPGNMSKAIPAVIPDAWAKGYWAWKTYDLCKWSPKWQDEMYWRFEGNYQEGRANTRHNPSGQSGDQGQNKTADDFAIEAQLRELRGNKNAA